LVELWTVSVHGWKTAASQESMTCEKHDSSRHRSEPFSLVLSAFTLLSLQKYWSELEQQDGAVVKVVGSDMRDLLWHRSSLLLLLA